MKSSMLKLLRRLRLQIVAACRELAIAWAIAALALFVALRIRSNPEIGTGERFSGWTRLCRRH